MTIDKLYENTGAGETYCALSNGLSNYKALVVFNGYSNDYKVIVGRNFIPTEGITISTTSYWADGGKNDRAIKFEFSSDTQLHVTQGSAYEIIRSVYGIK